MNKKALIGIIAGVVALIIAVVCIIVLPGDKNNDNKDETKGGDKESVESPIMVDGEPANMGSVAVNARTKTCLGKQREIQAQFINCSMSETIEINVGDEYELRTNEDGTAGEWVCINAQVDESETLYEMFQYVPYCPVGGNVIKVTIVANEYSGEYDSVTILTECCGEHETHNNDYEE